MIAFLQAIGVAFLTSVLSGALAGLMAVILVDVHHVTNREGASGYVVFYAIAAGVVAGGLTGFLASLLNMNASFLRQQGVAALTAGGLILVVSGISLLSALQR